MNKVGVGTREWQAAWTCIRPGPSWPQKQPISWIKLKTLCHAVNGRQGEWVSGGTLQPSLTPRPTATTQDQFYALLMLQCVKEDRESFLPRQCMGLVPALWIALPMCFALPHLVFLSLLNYRAVTVFISLDSCTLFVLYEMLQAMLTCKSFWCRRWSLCKRSFVLVSFSTTFIRCWNVCRLSFVLSISLSK